MAIDWDAELLAPVMAVFGEGLAPDRSTWPLYMPSGGAASFPLAGAVYDAEYQDVQPDGDLSSTTTTRPVLGVRASLFALPPKQNDRVYIPSVAAVFMVVEPRPDGHGHIKLMLMTAKDQSVA